MVGQYEIPRFAPSIFSSIVVRRVGEVRFLVNVVK